MYTMYTLEKCKKMKIIIDLFSALFVILAVIAYCGGGYAMLLHGTMKSPGYSILMVVSAGAFIVLFLLGKCLNAIQTDIAAELKFLNEKMDAILDASSHSEQKD